MFRTHAFAMWLAGAASVAVLTTGCSLAPKWPGRSTTNSTVSASSNKSQSSPFKVSVSNGSQVTSSTSSPGTPGFGSKEKLDDPAKVYLAYAIWHEQQGNLVEARNSFNRVLEHNSRSVDALLGLSRLDIAMSRLDDADQRLRKAYKLDPKNCQVAITRGQYYMACRDMPNALEQMTLARELSPDDTPSAYHLGVVQARMGDLDSALKNFTEAVGAAEAQYNLAYILYDQGNFPAAEEHLQKSLSMKPNLAQAQTLLKTVQHKSPGRLQQLVQTPPSRTPNDAASGVQPASYTEYARPERGTVPLRR